MPSAEVTGSRIDDEDGDDEDDEEGLRLSGVMLSGPVHLCLSAACLLEYGE